MNDLISREDAITAVAVAVLDDKDEIEAIKTIPSVRVDGDLISRADAICEVLVNDGIDNIVNRINALPSAEAVDVNDVTIHYKPYPSVEAVQGEWIPCSERLPKRNDAVLIQLHHNMIVGYWMYGDFENEHEWRSLTGDGWETTCEFPPDVFEPIAWMPLPTPYREDGEE